MLRIRHPTKQKITKQVTFSPVYYMATHFRAVTGRSTVSQQNAAPTKTTGQNTAFQTQPRPDLHQVFPTSSSQLNVTPLVTKSSQQTLKNIKLVNSLNGITLLQFRLHDLCLYILLGGKKTHTKKPSPHNHSPGFKKQ